MATVNREIEVTKELSELGEGIAEFVYQVRVAGADGFGADDLPKLAIDALKILVPAIQGTELIGEEKKESPEASDAALLMLGYDIYRAIDRKLPTDIDEVED